MLNTVSDKAQKNCDWIETWQRIGPLKIDEIENLSDSYETIDDQTYKYGH